MCNLFIQIYNEKTSEKQSERAKPVVSTDLSNTVSKCSPVYCNENVSGCKTKVYKTIIIDCQSSAEIISCKDDALYHDCSIKSA